MTRQSLFNRFARGAAVAAAAFALFWGQATAEEVERKGPVSQLEQSQFETNLEERLSRDIKSYLGHEFFITRVNALLEKVRVFDVKEEVVSPPPQSQPQAQPQPQPQAQEPPPEAVQAPPPEPRPASTQAKPRSLPGLPGDPGSLFDQMELETGEPADGRLPQVYGMDEPLPGIPLSREFFDQVQRKQAQKQEDQRREALLAQLREQRQRLERLEEQQRLERQKQQQPPPPKPVTKTTETLKDTRIETRKLTIKLLLDEHVTPDQEVFVRQLIIEKTDLNFLRGDELQISRTQFPGAAVLDEPEEPAAEEAAEPPVDEAKAAEEKKAQEEPPVEEPWWKSYWPYLVAGALLLALLLWLLLRRKEEPQPTIIQPVQESDATKRLEEVLSQLGAKTDTINQNRLQIIREEVMAMAVGDYGLVSAQLKDWMTSGSPEDVARMAGLHNMVGQGHFISLFRKLMEPEQMIAIAAKAQEQAQEMGSGEQLELAEGIYQSLVERKYRESRNAERERPFDFLERLNDDQILYLLSDENRKVKALVFSQLPADRSANMLRRLDDQDRSRIATEISRFREMPLATFRDVANRLARMAVNVPSFANVAMDGVDLLVDMLDHMGTADETALLKSLKRDNPKLYYEIKKVYISFNDLVRLPKMALKNLIREIDREQLALALYDMPDQFREAIYAVMLDRPRAMLQSVIDGLHEPDPEGVEEAKRMVARRARAMLKAGAFSLTEESPQERQDPPQARSA